MLTLLTGPESAEHARELVDQPVLWIDYAALAPPQGSCPVSAPRYPALASFAARAAHPRAQPQDLRITELSCLARGVSSERAPTLRDYDGQEALMRLSAMIAKGAPIHQKIMLIECSLLYDQLMAEIGRGLSVQSQKVLEFGRALASDALARVVSDIKRSGRELVITASDVLVQGKLYPNIPGSIRTMAELELACEGGRRLVVRSSLDRIKIGQELR